MAWAIASNKVLNSYLQKRLLDWAFLPKFFTSKLYIQRSKPIVEDLTFTARLSVAQRNKESSEEWRGLYLGTEVFWLKKRSLRVYPFVRVD